MTPRNFVPLLNSAKTVEELEHIESCVNDLYGFEFSPYDGGDQSWREFIEAKERNLMKLTPDYE